MNMLRRENKASSGSRRERSNAPSEWTDVGNTGLTLLPKVEIQELGSSQSV